MSKNYVLKSTQESRDSQTTSILAIVETIFFTFLTWGVAVYFDIYIHIYTAIAIAPFLLLKTPESIDKAINLFLYKPELDKKTYYKEPYFWFTLSITVPLVFFISYFFSTEILVHSKGWELYFLSVLLGAIVAGILSAGVLSGGIILKEEKILIIALSIAASEAGAELTIEMIAVEIIALVALIAAYRIKNKILQSLLSLLFSPILIVWGATIGLIVFIKSIVIKVVTTTFYALKHPLIAFFNISDNFKEQVMVNDVFYSPELLPRLTQKSKLFHVWALLSFIKSSILVFKFIFLLVIPIWSLGYFYRFSIKSTSWFFFPLAYLANLEALQDEEKKKKAIKTQTWKNLFWFNTIIAAILFLYFKSIGQYIDLLGLSETKLNFIKDAVFRLQKYFIPEAMWLLVVAVGLYFVLNMFISRQEHLGENQYPMFTYWLIKLITALWMIFLGWHLVVLVNHELMPVVKVWLGRT